MSKKSNHWSREELIALRTKARKSSEVKGLSSSWKRAYVDLADSLDRLDAMEARTIV